MRQIFFFYFWFSTILTECHIEACRVDDLNGSIRYPLKNRQNICLQKEVSANLNKWIFDCSQLGEKVVHTNLHVWRWSVARYNESATFQIQFGSFGAARKSLFRLTRSIFFSKFSASSMAGWCFNRWCSSKIFTKSSKVSGGTRKYLWLPSGAPESWAIFRFCSKFPAGHFLPN